VEIDVGLGGDAADLFDEAGWSPVSLLAIMMLMSRVLGWRARRTSPGSIRQSPPTGRKVTSMPRLCRCSAAWRTAWCSMDEVMRWSPGRTSPKRARLSPSVPPLVKTIFGAIAVEQGGDVAAGLLDRGARPAAVVVDRRGVAGVLEQVRAHGLEDLRRREAWWRWRPCRCDSLRVLLVYL
jgi:hypothetical protein